MENTLSLADVLHDIDETNVREKLQVLETECGARKLKLSNRLTDMVYLTESELLLVKCDFFTPAESLDVWLADEESYNGNPPLYFSEFSHRESPVYALRRARTFYSRFFPNPPFSFSLLLLCNYSITNYDDMLPVWEELGVTVIHNIVGAKFLFSEPAASGQETDELDDDDFEPLFEDFDEENSGDTKTDEGLTAMSLPQASWFELDCVKTFWIHSSMKRARKGGLPLKVFALRNLQ